MMFVTPEMSAYFYDLLQGVELRYRGWLEEPETPCGFYITHVFGTPLVVQFDYSEQSGWTISQPTPARCESLLADLRSAQAEAAQDKQFNRLPPEGTKLETNSGAYYARGYSFWNVRRGWGLSISKHDWTQGAPVHITFN